MQSILKSIQINITIKLFLISKEFYIFYIFLKIILAFLLKVDFLNRFPSLVLFEKSIDLEYSLKLTG